MTQRSYVGVLEVLALSVLALSGAYQMACVFRPMGFLNAYLMYRDDGYYYLELARNLAQSGVATFDGVHRTSGVQLLWTAVLVPLASALPSRSAFLHGVLVLSALLSTLAGLLLYRLGRVLDSRAFGSFAVLLWSGLMLTLRPMMQGLEYPLHVVIVLLLIGALFGLRDAGASLRRRRLLGLGTLLALNALCRLDAAIVSTLIWLPTCAWILRVRVDRRDALTRVLCLSGPLLLGALLTVLSFHAMAGTLVPISGSAKALYAQRYYEASPPLQHALELLRGFRYVHSGLIKNVLSGGLLVKADGLAARGIVWLFLLASGWLAYRVVRSNELAERRSTGAVLLALLAIGEVHMIAVVVQIGHFAFDTQHYYAWMTCSLLLWCVFLALELLRALPGPAVRGVGLSVVGVMLACDGTTIYRQSQLDLAEPRHEDQVLAAARWIDTHLPADARIGAWNAGQLAYFANRRVVNLDGLMNDASFLARLRSGASLCPYLKLEGIRYLADINRSDKSMRRDASWDEATSFRGDFLFEDTQVLFRAGDFYVLRLDRCREGEAQVVL